MAHVRDVRATPMKETTMYVPIADTVTTTTTRPYAGTLRKPGSSPRGGGACILPWCDCTGYTEGDGVICLTCGHCYEEHY
jgi:hypothetical protein